MSDDTEVAEYGTPKLVDLLNDVREMERVVREAKAKLRHAQMRVIRFGSRLKPQPWWRCDCGTHNEDIPEADFCWKCKSPRPHA